MAGRRLRRLLSSDGSGQIAFALATLMLLAVYPALSTTGQTVASLLAALAAIVAVAAGLPRIAAVNRRAWWLLLSALLILYVGNLARLLPGDLARTGGKLLDAFGYALVLVAALALVLRRGSSNLGSVIDTTIVALALGGLLWHIVVRPNLVEEYGSTADRANIFVIIFALSGVLGALGRLARLTSASTGRRLQFSLWVLIAAVLLGLAGNVVLAMSTEPWARPAASMAFIAVYGMVGLFALDPATRSSLYVAPPPSDGGLSPGRLIFLGVAVAVIPVVIGVRAFLGRSVDGVLLVTSGVFITVLVMLRIGLLSAERARAERALRHEAAHDPLTGLYNRREFLTLLHEEMHRVPTCVILFCDLNGFKLVNDTLGHGAGDQLLVEVARRLRACVRDTDVVSRFGGDEFLVLFRDAQLVDVEAICQRIAQTLSQPLILRGVRVTIGASIGVAVAGEAGPEELIRRADHAMYEAKRYHRSTDEVRIVRA